MAANRVIGVIPARLGSTRFPRKVLADVGGKPLVERAFERLAASSRVEDLLVATDSEEVERVVRAFGGRVVVVSEPCASGSDRVAAAVRGEACDVVVNLQADQVLVASEDIDRLVDALETDPAVQLTTLAYPSDDEQAFRDPDAVKVVATAEGRALYFSRAPVPASAAGSAGNPLFLHHVGIYCFRREALERFASLPQGRLEARESLEQLRALENGMAIGLVVTDRPTPAVDRPDDLAEVERRL